MPSSTPLILLKTQSSSPPRHFGLHRSHTSS
uniref:Uncharacterized protein n=1 Tax=Anguilla anguilla TaxID=7936 RepID=A0A0E9UBE6_ANGAN